MIGLLEAAQLRNGKKTELTYRCLCCDDKYYVSAWNIRNFFDQLYGYHDLIHNEWMQFLDPSVDAPFPGVTPYVCTRKGCDAGWVMEDVPVEDGRTTRKRVPRIGDDRYVLKLPPDVCQRIHDAIVDKLRSAEGDARPVAVEVLEKIAKPLSAKSNRMQSIGSVITKTPDVVEPVVFDEQEITEIDGFRVGDRVRIGIDHLSELDQRDVIRRQKYPLDDDHLVIQSFGINQAAMTMGLDHLKHLVFLKDRSGHIHKVAPSYLRTL